MSNGRGRFLTALTTEDLPGDRWRLTAPLVYLTAAGELIIVPTGFECDLTSAIDEAGDWDWGGCVHDWIYRTAKIGDRTVERAEADHILKECCGADAPNGERLHVAKSQGGFIGFFIRPTGWLAWRNWRKLEKTGRLNVLTGKLEPVAVAV